jgi:hypothetical protein
MTLLSQKAARFALSVVNLHRHMFSGASVNMQATVGRDAADVCIHRISRLLAGIGNEVKRVACNPG